MSKQRIVVIGNGMVGHRFIEEMVNSGQSDDYELITFCEESRYAYDRVHLSAFFPVKAQRIYHWLSKVIIKPMV